MIQVNSVRFNPKDEKRLPEPHPFGPKTAYMEKILIIDDDPDVITVLQLLLKKKGYDVATASREGEAYEKVASFHPDLIVMDVLLSGVDGRDICRKLKS